MGTPAAHPEGGVHKEQNAVSQEMLFLICSAKRNRFSKKEGTSVPYESHWNLRKAVHKIKCQIYNYLLIFTGHGL